MNMFVLAGIFLVIMIIAGIFGFKKTARKGTPVSKILFFIFMALFIVTLIFAFLQTYSSDSEEGGRRVRWSHNRHFHPRR